MALVMMARAGHNDRRWLFARVGLVVTTVVVAITVGMAQPWSG